MSAFRPFSTHFCTVLSFVAAESDGRNSRSWTDAGLFPRPDSTSGGLSRAPLYCVWPYIKHRHKQGYTNTDISMRIYKHKWTEISTQKQKQILIQRHWRRLISEEVWGLLCTVSMSYKQLLMNESLQTSGHYSLARWRVVYVYQFHNTSKIRFTCRCR